MNTYRFRVLTRDSLGAYTTVRANSQSEALADLSRQLAPWETAVPLCGPSQSPRWFSV